MEKSWNGEENLNAIVFHNLHWPYGEFITTAWYIWVDLVESGDTRCSSDWMFVCLFVCFITKSFLTYWITSTKTRGRYIGPPADDPSPGLGTLKFTLHNKIRTLCAFDCGSFGCWVSHFDDLVQYCSISIASALKILQFCTKPSICRWINVLVRFL